MFFSTCNALDSGVIQPLDVLLVDQLLVAAPTHEDQQDLQRL